MSVEHERRFRLSALPPHSATKSQRIQQVYWRLGKGWCLRLRRQGSPDEYLESFAVKGPREGSVRDEFKYFIFSDIPDTERASVRDALDRLFATGEPHVVEKIRHTYDIDGIRWEIDEFQDRHSPLIVAEVEALTEAEILAVPFPTWADFEVTPDTRYNNENLAYDDCSWITS